LTTRTRVSWTGQDGSEVIADGDLQATAGFDDGEDGRDTWSGFLAAEVDPGFGIRLVRRVIDSREGGVLISESELGSSGPGGWDQC